MANTDAARGFRPVRHLNGNPWNGLCNKYVLIGGTNSTDIFIGDIVKQGGSGYDGVPNIEKCGATEVPLGVFMGIENHDNLSEPWYDASNWSSGEYATALVVDDPDIVLEVQMDDDGSGQVENADLGTNYKFVDGGGSSTTGLSGEELDESSSATTSTYMFQLMRVSQRPDNAVSSTCADVEVRFNVHQFKSVGTTGI